jgi:phosphoserine phosphatase
VIVAATRTAIGKFGGSLAKTPAPELGAAVIKELLRRAGLAPEQTMAVGDGANDLAMLGEAGLGVAFRAKPVVAAAARATLTRGAQFDAEGLRAVVIPALGLAAPEYMPPALSRSSAGARA